jgi:hypothetical protein
VLLSDPEVAAYLKDQVVPAWETVREVPKLTLDFGNGKKITRTLAGNTSILLCTADGKVMDAFPGVYTPADFLRELKASLAASKDPQQLLAWHVKEGLSAPVPRQAMSFTMGKAVIEAPLLQALNMKETPFEPAPETETPDSAKRIFSRYAMMLADLSKSPASRGSVLRTIGLPRNATPQQIVAMDSRNNVRAVRPAVHLWLATLDKLPTPEEAKNVMFKQLLHIPIDDPYLGLGDTLPGTGN